MAEYLELSEAEVLRQISKGAIEPVPIRPLLVIGAVEAGMWREALEWPASDHKLAPVSAVDRYASLPQFGLEVRGPSMNELYPHGSVVVCVRLLHLGRDPKPNERVICLRRSPEGFEATVKELRQDMAGAYWLWPRSDNPNFQQPWQIKPPAELDDNEDIRIVAIVIGSYRPEPN